MCAWNRRLDMERNKQNKIEEKVSRKRLLIITLDILAIAVSFFLALWIRFDFRFGMIPREYLFTYLNSIFIWCGISVLAFAVAKLYNSVWVFVSTNEFFRICLGLNPLFPRLYLFPDRKECWRKIS